MKGFVKIHDIGHCSCGEEIDFFYGKEFEAGKELKNHLSKGHEIYREIGYNKTYKK